MAYSIHVYRTHLIFKTNYFANYKCHDYFKLVGLIHIIINIPLNGQL